MPVTIKLSKLFHERLGEELANELVGWFNQVDATYRIELKEFNELNFARFDAKLEQRLSEFSGKLEARITALDAKIDRVSADLSAKLDTKADRTAMADLREGLERRLGEQTRWLVVMWSSLLIPIVGLWFRG